MSRPVLRTAERALRSALPRLPTSSPSGSRSALRVRACAFSTSRVVRDEQPAPVSPKVAPIVDAIAGMTLLEVADLVGALKTRLNITEIAMPAASAAPVAAAAGGADAGEPAEEKPKEKTIFNVKLEKIDPANKAKVIREVKLLQPSMTLVEAKKFVESCPQILKENLPKEDAEKLQKTLEALGATIVLE